MKVDIGREEWRTTSGFVLACIGSAVGIANIWRFPYIVGENGGGAFLIPFLLVVVGLGVFLMMLEFAIGKHFQASIVKSLERIRRRLKWAGVTIAVVAAAILSYYMVIIGWIGFYLVSFGSNVFVEFEQLTNTYFSLFGFVLVSVIVLAVISRGVIAGIEQFNKYAVLLLMGILVPFAAYTATLPGALDGVYYFLTPDMSALTKPEIWAIAIGQAFFSLSLGSGSLLTYGSYLGKRQPLLKPIFIIISTNTVVSMTAAVLIFSLVFSSGQSPAQGLPLIFNVLPEIFSSLEYGSVIGLVFFFLVFIAGLTSAIGLFQVPTASLQDSLRLSRKSASLVVFAIVLAAGIPSALSYTSLNLSIGGTRILDAMDDAFGTYGITIAELSFVVAVTWFMHKKEILEKFNRNSSFDFPNWVIFAIKFVAPALILFTLGYTAFLDILA